MDYRNPPQVRGDKLTFMNGCYFDKVFNNDPEQLVKNATIALHNVDFDSMVAIGLSGTLITPIIARGMGKDYMILRKDGVSSHSSNLGEGFLGKRWIFVDDFIASGRTLRKVQERIDEICDMAEGFETEYVGAYLYQDFTNPAGGFRLPSGQYVRNTVVTVDDEEIIVDEEIYDMARDFVWEGRYKDIRDPKGEAIARLKTFIDAPSSRYYQRVSLNELASMVVVADKIIQKEVERSKAQAERW